MCVLLGDTDNGGYPQWGLALHGLALTFARPRPPALTPLVLAPHFRTVVQYGNGGLVQRGLVFGVMAWRSQGKTVEG